MKEASGEANLTIVAIILIGVIAAVVTPIITSMMKNTSEKACCTNVGGVWTGGDCDVSNVGGANAQAEYDECLRTSEVNR
ncbi:MAG: hypothetical protein PHO63_00500 [Bacilli bacterium]|nr:hypothetical protein [Bacilli bacterium]MDD4809207.1 hypothetical protein [Bacilli bacterium]